jgi:Tfp pilus assembly protein FimT
MKQQQRGVGLVGLVLVGSLVAVLGLLAAQLVPTLIEYQAVARAAKRAAGGHSVAEVRALFDKAAAIDDIRSLQGKDLEIRQENDQVVVEFAYERQIHLAGPAWLVMRYSGSSR